MKNFILFLICIISLSQVSFIRPLKAEECDVSLGWEYITLRSSNWEGMGENIEIKSDGNYVSYLTKAGAVEGEAKEGTIDLSALISLTKFINDAGFYSFVNEYPAQVISKIGADYELTLKGKAAEKTVKFYLSGEKENAPAGLIEIVNKIYSLVR